jgi:hypothetical protein
MVLYLSIMSFIFRLAEAKFERATPETIIGFDDGQNYEVVKLENPLTFGVTLMRTVDEDGNKSPINIDAIFSEERVSWRAQYSEMDGSVVHKYNLPKQGKRIIRAQLAARLLLGRQVETAAF